MSRWRSLSFLAVIVVGLAAVAGWAGAAEQRGWWSHGNRSDFAASRWCDAPKLEATLADIRSVLALHAEQIIAWHRLTAAVTRGAARSCESERVTGGAEAELAQAEAALARGLETLREIRPSFDTLYAMLDDDQRKRLDTLFAWRRRV